MIVTDANVMGEKADPAYAPVGDMRVVPIPYSDDENAPAAPPVYDTSLPTFNNRTYAARTEPAWRRFLRAIVVGLLIWLAAGMVAHKLLRREGSHKHPHPRVSLPTYMYSNYIQSTDRPSSPARS